MTRKKAYPGFSDRAAILKKYLPGKDLWDKTFPKSDKVDHCKVPFVNRSAVLVMHGDKAHSCYFGRDAYANMVKDSKYTDNKELLIIPSASHTDLYDGGENHAIPFDKLESFFTEYLK